MVLVKFISSRYYPRCIKQVRGGLSMLDYIRNKTSKTFILSVITAFLMLGTFSAVNATGIVPAGEAVKAEAQIDHQQKVEAFLARADVQAQMESLGVDTDMAKERVAALSAEELQMLSGEIDQIPAGGDALVIVGIVFVVLLVLELVGVTNFFTSI